MKLEHEKIKFDDIRIIRFKNHCPYPPIFRYTVYLINDGEDVFPVGSHQSLEDNLSLAMECGVYVDFNSMDFIVTHHNFPKLHKRLLSIVKDSYVSDTDIHRQSELWP